MIENPFFLLSTLLSSLFSFFTTAFAVDMGIKIFSVRRHRLRSNLRLIPFISVIVNFFSSEYSLAYWINPLSCASCLQKLFLTMFFPGLKAYLTENQISLVTYLGGEYQYPFLLTFGYAFGIISLLFVIDRLVRMGVSSYRLYKVVKKAPLYKDAIPNSLASRLIEKYAVKVHVSDQIRTPLTVYPKHILVSLETITALSSEEFDGVMAHEWEHIKHKDPLIRLFAHLISILFWWVPMGFWMKKIEQDQEMACDHNASFYGVSRETIASALYKVSKEAKRHEIFCYFTSKEHPSIVRIQMLLGLRHEVPNPLSKPNFCGVCLGGMLLLLCGLYF